MHTVTLQAIKHPSRIAVLLRALVQTFEMIPERAREIADRDGLPPPLRRIAAQQLGQRFCVAGPDYRRRAFGGSLGGQRQ